MKKLTYLLLVFGIIFIGYMVFYLNDYRIKDNREDIQSSLEIWISSGNTKGIEPDVLDFLRIGDTKSYLVLFQTGSNKIGYAHYKKGWNGRLKIENVGYGTNIVKYQKVKTNKGIYGILVGKNPELKIEKIKVKLFSSEFNFKVDVSTDEVFVKYSQLPKSVNQPFPANLVFYDKNSNVIELTELFNN
ncbi:hypothetical protein [Psychrobacillus sp. NPDC096623]|uniref:hypothetical protein n=1 Tax=Psychrobacillus sp. NPDC096623 TaxID=3364492 RepID=UPI003805796E